MTCLDGFITTHSIDRAEILDDEAVAGFVGDYEPAYALLDTDNPVSHGNFAGLGGPYFEFKKQQRVAIDRVDGASSRRSARSSRSSPVAPST